MKSIDLKHFKGDLFGGINAGIVALPAALGFGALAGLKPEFGLYSAIILGLIAAIFGGTKTLISNPTGPMAVVTFDIVFNLSEKLGVVNAPLDQKLEVIWPYLFFIFLIAGAFQILFGVFKIGKYVHYIPTPVISGFMSGIGVIIIVSQIPKLLGTKIAVNGTIDILLALPEMILSPDIISVSLGLATMAIIYFFPKITKVIPSALVAIVVVTTVFYFVGSKEYLIPAIPSDLPDLGRQLGFFARLGELFTGENSGMLIDVLMFAIYLAAIGLIDALLTAVVADQLTKEKHDSDRELIGQGLGNGLAALFGGMMGAGTTPATVLNIKSGARTRLSGVIHALFLVLILAVAAPVASLIPKAALAGLLITVGISILDFEVMKQIKKIPIQDNVVMFTVLILTASWDLMYAVFAGLIMAALIFMKKMADVVEGESKGTKFDRLVNDIIDNFEGAQEFKKQVIVKNMRGPMFFGFASRFQDSIDELPKLKAVVLNMGGVNYMDQSGMYTLKEAITSLVDKDVNVCLSELHDNEEELLKGIGVIPGLVDYKHVFSSVEECVMWLNEPGHLNNEFAADDELYIPTAYTPNGDGINDEWQIRNIENYPNCVVKIFSREGELLFESLGYKEMWEGVYNGRNLPTDKYIYEIDLQGNGEEVRKGKVSIFR